MRTNMRIYPNDQNICYMVTVRLFGSTKLFVWSFLKMVNWVLIANIHGLMHLSSVI